MLAIANIGNYPTAETTLGTVLKTLNPEILAITQNSSEGHDQFI